MLKKAARWTKHRILSLFETPREDYLGRKWELNPKRLEALSDEIVESAFGGVPVSKRDLPSSAHGPNIVLFAAKKSASTFLVQLLSKVFDYPHVGIGFNRGGGAFYYPRVLSAVLEPTPTVSRCHQPAAWYTIDVVEALRLTPIVLTRNLLDSLVSWRDHTVRAGRAEELLSTDLMNDFKSMSNEKQMDITIDACANRYINFYMSWTNTQISDIPVLFVNYKEVKNTPIQVLHSVAEVAGLSLDAGRAGKIADGMVERREANYNKGISGRGRENLTDTQIQRIGEIAKNMGCTDQEFLGFDPLKEN